MKDSQRKATIATSFLIPMLLVGIIWLPLIIIFTIGSIMAGWPEILGVIILLVLFLFLGFVPQLLLKKFGIQPRVPALIFLLGLFFNILAIAIVILALVSLDRIRF